MSAVQKIINKINAEYAKNPIEDREGLYQEILDTFKRINVAGKEFDCFSIPNYDIFIANRIRMLRIEIGIKRNEIPSGYSDHSIGLGGKTTATLIDMGQYKKKDEPYCIIVFDDARFTGITGNMLYYEELQEIKKKMPEILEYMYKDITESDSRFDRDRVIQKRINELERNPNFKPDYTKEYKTAEEYSVYWSNWYRKDRTPEEDKELKVLKKEQQERHEAYMKEHKEKVEAFRKAHPDAV